MLQESEPRLSNGLEYTSSNFLRGEVTQDCTRQEISPGVVFDSCSSKLEAAVTAYFGFAIYSSEACVGGESTACDELFFGNLVNEDSVRKVPGGIAVQEVGGDGRVSAIAEPDDVKVRLFANQEELDGFLATVQVASPEASKYVDKSRTSLAESLIVCTSIGILGIAALTAVVIGRLIPPKAPARRVTLKLSVPPKGPTQPRSSNDPNKIKPLPSELELLGTRGMMNNKVRSRRFKIKLRLIKDHEGVYSQYTPEQIEAAEKQLISEFVGLSGALPPIKYIEIE